MILAVFAALVKDSFPHMEAFVQTDQKGPEKSLCIGCESRTWSPFSVNGVNRAIFATRVKDFVKCVTRADLPLAHCDCTTSGFALDPNRFSSNNQFLAVFLAASNRSPGPSKNIFWPLFWHIFQGRGMLQKIQKMTYFGLISQDSLIHLATFAD